MTDAVTKPTFRCPPTMRPHALSVLQGEYDIPGLTFADGDVVLDIGANVGAFAVWAATRWPSASIACFEPHPDNATLLRANVAHLPSVHVEECAIFADGPMRLYDGANNCGESSLWRGNEQASTGHDVVGWSPSRLGPAAVLKADTEGAELAVILGYRYLASATQAVMYEWHHPRDRAVLADYLGASGFALVGDTQRTHDRGVARWIRRQSP